MCRLRLLVCVLFAVSPFIVNGQATSNKGKDFYVPYTAHIDGKNSRMVLILSCDVSTNYVVYIGNTVFASGSISANNSVPVIIDPQTVDVYVASSEDIEKNKAVHVTTDKQISLYSIIYYNKRTGGTMVIPKSTLGKDYYVFSHKNFGQLSGDKYSQFAVLATEDDTEISVHPTQASRTSKHAANTSFTIILNKGEIYQYQSAEDLTGSYISSKGDCKPISVFSGSMFTAFCEDGSSKSPSGGDNLYQQLFPVSAWGKNFVTSPFYNTLHGNTDAFRIIVSEDNTTLSVNGSNTMANGTPLNNPYSKGAIIEFFSTSPNLISADKPIALGHYQSSQTCNPNNSNNNNTPYPGDPELTMLNPVEQTLNDITVFSNIATVLGDHTAVTRFFINVVIKSSDVASFKIDGVDYSSSFTAISNSQYSYAVIDVTLLQAQHRLTANGGFSAIAYGYGDRESYAYLAGANVQSYTFEATDLADNSIKGSCAGQGFKLKINLPGEATNLVWKLANKVPVTQTNPTATLTTKDGNLFYTYSYPDDILINEAGEYSFSVDVIYKNVTNCGNTETVSSDFKVYDIPSATFNVSDKVCLGNPAIPVIVNNNTSEPVTKWKWQFDSEVVETENPRYTFNTIGKHTIKLSVSNSGGCWSEVVEKEIEIYPLSQSAFSAPDKTCLNVPVIFTDQSTLDNSVNTSSIIFWKWNFGDNSDPVTNPNGNPVVHTFTQTGEYTVTLYTTTSAGCAGTTFTKKINVYAIPKPDFTTPDVCSADGVATFVNASTDPADGAGTFTYQWSFGDPASISNTSTEKDGKHQYVTPGPYDVTLTITNSNGCTDFIKKSFIVNGRVDVADFTVLNPDNLCSNKEVLIKSGFTALVGKVVKLEIYKDYLGSPSSITKTVMYPNNTDEISLSYDAFGGNQNKQFTIRIVGYTGDNTVCTKEISKTVTLKPVPQISFDDITAVCENDGAVMLTNASESSGILGSGIYSSNGEGMAENGLYNPKVAGPGIHNITYTFKADNGCESAVTKSIEVYSSPIADAGLSVTILAGGEMTIAATAVGKNLIYQWSPALGLSRTDILNPVAAPEKDTEYKLTITSQPDGCTASSSVSVKVLQSINPPNTFTPNGDNVNDVWEIKYLDSYPQATVEVFNRNGNRVFYSSAYKVPFDGTYQNEPLPVGVYYYIINPRNGRKTITGPLTIIR